jgi:hypothetical protein
MLFTCTYLFYLSQQAQEKEDRLKDRIAVLAQSGEEMMANHEQVIANMRTSHADSVQQAWNTAAEEKATLIAKHNKAIEELSAQIAGLSEASQLETQEHEDQLEQVANQHIEECAALEEQHKEALDELEHRFQNQLNGEVDEHEALKAEYQGLSDELTSVRATAAEQVAGLERQLQDHKQEMERNNEEFVLEIEDVERKYQDQLEEHLEVNNKEWEKKVVNLQEEKRKFQKRLNESEEEKLKMAQGIERMSRDNKMGEQKILETQQILATNQQKQHLQEINTFKEWLAAGISIIEHPMKGKPRSRVCWMSGTGKHGGLRLTVAKEVTGTWNTEGVQSKDRQDVELGDVLGVQTGCDTENFLVSICIFFVFRSCCV